MRKSRSARLLWRVRALAAQRILKSVIALPLTQSGSQPQRQHHGARLYLCVCYSVPRRNIFLLISIAYHRRYGRAVWIDPVVLRAITISWNNIIIPVRSCPYHGHPDDNPLPWFTNDFGLPRMRCGTERPQVNSTRAVPRATVIILMPRPHCDRGKLTSTAHDRSRLRGA